MPTECAMWKSLLLEHVRDIGREFIFYCNFSLKTLPHPASIRFTVTGFQKDVLNAWQRIVAHTPLNKNEVQNAIIWNNKFVTIAGKSVFYRSWYDTGVKYIKDLITENVNLLTFNVLSIPSELKHTFCSIWAFKHYSHELEKETQE